VSGRRATPRPTGAQQKPLGGCGLVMEGWK